MSNRSKPCTTIFTDASFYHDTGRAGWGVVAIRDGQYEEGSGKIKHPCASPADAELRAMANGLAFASARGMLADKPIVVLQSDSIDALSLLLHSDSAYRHSRSKELLDSGLRSWARLPREANSALTYIKTLHDKHEFVLMLRHVKGHKRNDGRYRMNARADTLAKQGALS